MILYGAKGRGQALIMVTLAILAMCGVLGLAVDLGWSYYVRRNAQAAADSAALAAVATAQRLGLTYSCGAVGCNATPSSCASPTKFDGTNLDSACVYAAQNGFSQGGNVNVTVASNVSSPAPTVPGVAVIYWVTVRVNQSIPQLFSAVLGNPTALVSARATAAWTNVVFQGSLSLLNRQFDSSGDPNLGAGTDLYWTGSGSLNVPSGIMIASQKNPGAGVLLGSQHVTAPFTDILGGGTVENNSPSIVCPPSCSSPASWSTPPVSKSDGPIFWDPFSGKGQPPLVAPSLPDVPVLPTPGFPLGGNLPAGTYGPGNYYAVDSKGIATGVPINLSSTSGSYTFNNSSGFGEYVFYGGFVANGSQHITMAPGQYVFARTIGSATSNGTNVLYTNGSPSITESASGGGAGIMFVFAGMNYPGLPIPGPVQAISQQLGYGSVYMDGSGPVTLHGLNASQLPGFADALQPFAPVVFWQDQGNSHIAYDGRGYVQDGTFCGGDGTLDHPCTNPAVATNSTTPQLYLNGSSTITSINGAIYQPRGAWFKFNGSGLNSAVQLVTGGMDFNGSPSLNITGVSNSITTLQIALIE